MSNLALDLRPQSLSLVAGNDSIKKAIQSFIDKKNFPNVILLVGPSGTGKTTLAEIIVREAGCDSSSIHQINGSDKNGVDDARELADMAGSAPFAGTRRAFIINECQRMTAQAMDCLLEPMEKTPALWVLTSTDPGKIIPAIKSRAAAATFNLLPLNNNQIKTFLSQFADLDTRVQEFLITNDIRAPREILGILDQFYAGVRLEDCALGEGHEPLYRDVAGAVLRGDWTKASGLLSQIKTADARGMIGITSAFLRGELLKNPVGPRADALAVCLVGMDQTGFADGVAYGAVAGLLYKCCKALGAK